VCRNIKKLRKPVGVPTQMELHDAALQFVRKISGFREPSQVNQSAFERAVNDVAAAAEKMFEKITTKAQRH